MCRSLEITFLIDIFFRFDFLCFVFFCCYYTGTTKNERKTMQKKDKFTIGRNKLKEIQIEVYEKKIDDN